MHFVRRRRHLAFLLALAVPLCAPGLVVGQLINGQFFTNGLAIIDAPAPNSEQNTGGNIAIAVDVSGDGKIGTVSNTAFAALTIFLVSAAVGVNVTVSDGAGFLAGEPSSTVKHLSWPIPKCLPAGNYDLIFYETSTFQSKPVFAITPVPMKINSQATASPPNFACISPPPSAPQALPQAQAPLAFAPFVPGSTYTTTTTGAPASSPPPPVATTPLGSASTTPPPASTASSPPPPGAPTTIVVPPPGVPYSATSSPAPASASPGFIVPVSAAPTLIPPRLVALLALVLLGALLAS